jgi:hypothetical protein
MALAVAFGNRSHTFVRGRDTTLPFSGRIREMVLPCFTPVTTSVAEHRWKMTSDNASDVGTNVLKTRKPFSCGCLEGIVWVKLVVVEDVLVWYCATVG